MGAEKKDGDFHSGSAEFEGPARDRQEGMGNKHVGAGLEVVWEGSPGRNQLGASGV